jgi:hypothetical protein
MMEEIGHGCVGCVGQWRRTMGDRWAMADEKRMLFVPKRGGWEGGAPN